MQSDYVNVKDERPLTLIKVVHHVETVILIVASSS